MLFNSAIRRDTRASAPLNDIFFKTAIRLPNEQRAPLLALQQCHLT